jgi:hypothetical protein
MKRPRAIVLLLLLVVVSCNPSRRKVGDDIVAKVEQFRKSTGHLPNTLADIAIRENERCPCYCTTGEDSYIVWYGTTLGESDAYDSRTKTWSETAGSVCSRKGQ